MSESYVRSFSQESFIIQNQKLLSKLFDREYYNNFSLGSLSPISLSSCLSLCSPFFLLLILSHSPGLIQYAGHSSSGHHSEPLATVCLLHPLSSGFTPRFLAALPAVIILA